MGIWNKTSVKYGAFSPKVQDWTTRQNPNLWPENPPTYLSISILNFTIWYSILQVYTQASANITVHSSYGLAYLTESEETCATGSWRKWNTHIWDNIATCH